MSVIKKYMESNVELDAVIETIVSDKLIIADKILDELNKQGINHRNVSVQFDERPKLFVDNTDLDVDQLDSDLSPFWTVEIRNNKVEVKPQ